METAREVGQLAHVDYRGGRGAHNMRQGAAFDMLADEFLRPIPDDVVARTRRILLAVDLRQGQRVLDVGTGTGALLPLILAARPRRLVACDLSQQMLARARSRFNGRISFFHGDVIDLPRELGPFDRVICNAMFGNVYDQQGCLIAVRQLLAPQGSVTISHPMGRQFVMQLHLSNPDLVPHGLPERGRLEELADGAALRVLAFCDQPELYVAVLAR